MQALEPGAVTFAAEKNVLIEGLAGMTIPTTMPALGVETRSPLTISAFTALADAFERD